MGFLERLRRVLYASLAAVIVSWPLVGFTATAGNGAAFSLEGALKIGALVLGLGIAYTLWLALWGLVPGGGAERVRAAVDRRPALGASLLMGVVIFMAAVPLFASRSWTANLVETLVFATIALGLNISMGMAGLLVLGHAAFWAVGAYTFSMLVIHQHWNFWLAFPAAGAAAALAGLVVGLPALRLRGDYLAIVTLGFGEAIRWVFKNEGRLTGGDAGIPGSEVPGKIRALHGFPVDAPFEAIGDHAASGLPFRFDGYRAPDWLHLDWLRKPTWLWQPRTSDDCYWFALGLLVLCVTCVTLLSRSRFGRALFALREDETAAKCMGIDTVRVKLIAFTASAFWAGLAGVVHPIFRGQITPQLFDFNASVLFVAMVVLGGLGSIPGSILGAAVLFILPQVLRDKFPAVQEYRMLIFGAVLTALMVVRPEGLFGSSKARPEAEPGDGGEEGAEGALAGEPAEGAA